MDVLLLIFGMFRLSTFTISSCALLISGLLFTSPLAHLTFSSPQTITVKDSAPLVKITPVPTTVASNEQLRQKRLVHFLAQKYDRSPAMIEQIVTETHTESKAKDIDPLLFLAVISVESNFDPQARSHAGAIGLVQFIPRWHPEKVGRVTKSGAKITDIRPNIQIGVQILDEYRKIHKGNLQRALLSYNGSLKDPNGRYAKKVLAEKVKLEQVFNTPLPPSPVPEKISAPKMMAEL